MREVEAFLTVADERHFGRAAQRLHVSTAHVSQTIRTLERRVGDRLFDRTSRRVELTPLGHQLLAEFRPAYERLQRALRAAQDAAQPRGRATLRIGFTTSLPPEIPRELTEAFERECSGCRAVRSAYPGTDINRWLDTGEIIADVYVLWWPRGASEPDPAKVRRGPEIWHEPRALLMAAKHPLSRRATVDIEELADHTLLYPSVAGSFGDAWTPPVTPGGKPIRRVVAGKHVYVEDLPDVLDDGDLAHITMASFPRIGLTSDLVTVPLTGLPDIACVTAWSATNPNPWIQRFVEFTATTDIRGPRLSAS